ncbi:hypothetical protein TorRG33x02_310230 [Trema orientale]|uniref:Uncharacterized protein n=1 Tax=Trema orientale TaxID=63057 RepID=A0A2P5BSQ1_TREOI|nr:hypothetical protein TorRG33x02_310230 [Trema orientale]
MQFLTFVFKLSIPIILYGHYNTTMLNSNGKVIAIQYPHNKDQLMSFTNSGKDKTTTNKNDIWELYKNENDIHSFLNSSQLQLLCYILSVTIKLKCSITISIHFISEKRKRK